MNIYTGNLSYDMTEQDMAEIFGEFGKVTSAKIITDRNSGRSKGFGFIEMENDDEAKTAIEELHEAEVDGRNMIVNEAKPREDRPRRRSF